jgi:hypothetical protein
MPEQKKQNGVQGEGDYRSARVYKKDIDKFMTEKGDEIGDFAKQAEEALDGPERDQLEKAEEKGKSKARH